MARNCPWSLVVLLIVGMLCVGCPGKNGQGNGTEVASIPEEVVRLNNLGTAFLSQQEWGDAEAEFRKGLEKLPGDPVLLNNTAVALIQQGERVDDAASLLSDALTADPDQPFANYNLGLLEKSRGGFDIAVEHFRRVVEQDATDVFAQYYLGSTLGQTGDVEQAESALRAALEIDETHVSTLYALGQLLIRKGDRDAGSELIARSQDLRGRGFPAGGIQYGEQGPYALGALYPADVIAAPEPIEVTFEVRETPSADATAAGGSHALFAAGDSGVSLWAAKGLRPALDDTAAGLGDIDGAEVLAIAAGDLDGDRRLELLALIDRGGKSEVRVGGSAGWDGPRVALGDGPGTDASVDLTVVDKDHDGDLDLFGCWAPRSGSGSSGCLLLSNDGKGGLSVDPAEDHKVSLPAGASGPVSVAFSDYDNDRDVDLIAASSGGVHVFTNLRDGSFGDVSTDVGLSGLDAAVGSVDVADLDKDGWMDLLIGSASGAQILMNERGNFARATAVSGSTAGDATACDGGKARAFDYDNDGYLDIAMNSGGCSLTVVRNLGAGEWGEPMSVADGTWAPLASYDADGDGDLDLAAAGDGAYALLVNQGGNANNWLTVDMQGVGDNTHGIGTKAVVLAGALRQKFELRDPLPLHAGLGKHQEADAVRLLWPGGVLQDEIRQAANKPNAIEQLDRKGTSCPLMYAWRDGRWQFVTDFLGGAAIGYQKAPGVFSTPDTDEYVLLEGGLTADDGTLRVRFNNQLEEVIWFDKAQLVVVDHPAGTAVFPNERLMPAPPFPEFRLFASDDIRPVRSARTLAGGRDVTAALATRDRDYVDGFRLEPFKGYAEMHGVELDLGSLPADERVVLLLDGWIDYADSSANVGAVQAGLSLTPPRLSVADGQGGWQTVDGRMGFPAGLPKTMSVDLTGLFRGDHRVRIETNMRIYWDRAQVMVGGAATPLRVTRLDPVSAELRDGGFPRPVTPDGKKPKAYDPQDVERYGMWKAHVGAYTGFGDVRALLGAIDDRFVTTRNGDELELRFEAPAAVEPGWQRSYLLFADGFGKDMDPNSAVNNTIGPLPFHGMPHYPYGDEVSPPERVALEEPAPRIVLPAEDGMPGALPLELRAASDQ